jgi:hypothetical protein
MIAILLAAVTVFYVDHMTQQQVKQCMCKHGYCTPKAQEELWFQWVCTDNPVCAAEGRTK